MLPPPPRSTLFPYTTLFRSFDAFEDGVNAVRVRRDEEAFEARPVEHLAAFVLGLEDRKSTRLNSSHTVISYAVFCLKKKKTTKKHPSQAPPHLQRMPQAHVD